MDTPSTIPDLLRDQSSPTITNADSKLIGPNEKRVALIISSPVPLNSGSVDDTVLTSAASTTTTGVKSTYTVPAGVQATLVSASFLQISGVAGVICALQIIRGATITVVQFTNSGTFLGSIPLIAGDVVQWNCTTLVNPSTSDFTIGIIRERGPARITLNVQGPAVLDAGINLYAGNAPLYLTAQRLGKGLREEIRAIASVASLQVSVLDVFTK